MSFEFSDAERTVGQKGTLSSLDGNPAMIFLHPLVPCKGSRVFSGGTGTGDYDIR